jgi:flagella basal body P-ring formation protein FlgA
MRYKVAITSLVLIIGLVTQAVAETSLVRKTEIRMQGRSEVVVTEPVVKLSDVATIESAAVADDEAILEMRKIVISPSPRAGESQLVQGASILERMRDAGLRLDSIYYTFPKEIKVTRAFREVFNEELEQALRAYLSEKGRTIDVKHIVAAKPVKIPADSFGVEVVNFEPIQPGHYGVDFRSRAGSDEVRFQMRALGDEWKVMPVASKSLKRGEIVTASDVKMEKVNGTIVTRDSIEQVGDIVGREMRRDLGQGEMFNNIAVAIPPVINAGSKVTVVFKRGRLEASALGVAMESGVERQEIKVRNESSKKIITARIREVGVVEVGGNVR